MAGSIMTSRRDWRMCRVALADRFEHMAPEAFAVGEVDLEALWRLMLPPPADVVARGRILIGHDLRNALQRLPGCPEGGALAGTPMVTLFPRAARRQAWADLQAKLEWRLPRIGLPIWAQYVWGAALIGALVLMFWWPIVGTALFFGGIILSYRAEHWSTAFQYPTVEATLSAMVRLNFPALEVGAVEDLPLRLLFAEVLDSHFIPIENPEAPFPKVFVDDPFATSTPAMHVLNGDALRAAMDAAEVRANRVVIRECFVVGPVPGKLDDAHTRSAWIASEYGAPQEKYRDWVTRELQQLSTARTDCEFNLWFEDDLFCLVNLWFAIAYLDQLGRHTSIFRVFPPVPASARWEGFAHIDEPGLCLALANRIPFSPADLELGRDLWEAFRQQDFPRLLALSRVESPCFRDLPAVVQAHIDRFPSDSGLGRPERALRQILSSGKVGFADVFAEFTQLEGIYGFGELQVQALLRRLSSPQFPTP